MYGREIRYNDWEHLSYQYLRESEIGPGTLVYGLDFTHGLGLALLSLPG